MNIERTEGPFLAKQGEFRYKSDTVLVQKNQEYFIDYLMSKKVQYRLVINDELIERDIMVDQEKYENAYGVLQRDTYPQEYYPTSKDLNFDSTYITRTFAKSKLNVNAPILEVKSKTETDSFIFISIQWQISGVEDQVKLFNSRQLTRASAIMPGITEHLPLLQLHEDKIIQDTDPINLISKNPMYTHSGHDSIPPAIRTIRRKKRKMRRDKRKGRGAKSKETNYVQDKEIK